MTGQPGDMATKDQAVIARRDPGRVMRLSRLGSLHQSRLSFMRILLRRLRAEGWRYARGHFDIDARGVGTAVYTMQGPERAYSLVAFGHDLPPEDRSDRVIATAWDATFTLFDGIPSAADIDRLRREIPRQEAGRVSARELSVSRANRSVRLFDHVVAALAEGRQPDADLVARVGYVMRTTAVYGSGKLGAADRAAIAHRPEFTPPFQVEMLTVWLIRAFVLDLVEEMARQRAPDTATVIAPELRRQIGIGNSTGLGMAPFLISHPILFNNWIMAREEALARVRAIALPDPARIARFTAILARARQAVALWRSDHPVQIARLADLTEDLARLAAHLDSADLAAPLGWDRLWRWGEAALHEEGQEMLVSLLLEPHGDLVDGLACCMAADEDAGFTIDGAMTVGQLREILRDVHGWALDLDWDMAEAQARTWYVSAAKQEPRLGETWAEDLADYAQPLAPGRDAARLFHALAGEDAATAVAGFVLRHPEHRHSLRRAQIAARHPYAEIRDNTIGADLMPIDMLRAKLSFFGAGYFDPRSDRWVRINMFRGAPFPHELHALPEDDWAYPPAGAQA
jgi:hypothetical protein